MRQKMTELLFITFQVDHKFIKKLILPQIVFVWWIINTMYKTKRRANAM